MSIKVTGNPQIDTATAEIAGALRDGGFGRRDQDRYDEAMRLRDEILAGQDTRTDTEVDAEACRVIEQSIYAGGRTNAEVAEYTVRLLRKHGLLNGARPPAGE